MRKHGWQLPYHPLQVVAIAVFLALGFAFYVFFAPFVGRKLLQYVAMGLYTPLIVCVFSLYIWCAAADPADPGVFKSKKYCKNLDLGKHGLSKESKRASESTSSICDVNPETVEEKSADINQKGPDASVEGPNTETEKKKAGLWAIFPCACICGCSNFRKESPNEQFSEDGMFYCNLCKVEVFKYSKHCRVCDKCIDRFDHHCRWINNCIGKKNYRQFFTLMVASLLMLILQWSAGILVLVCCFLERNRYAKDITSKLGSSFSLVPFIIVVALCTILAMIATLPLAQLFFFHILLIKKGISTYDYIIALREQEQQAGGGQQSPQMSPASSITGLSSASSFTTFRRGAWCTPPRLFLEDQFDVVPPDTASISSSGKKMVFDEVTKKRNPGAVKINPWTLARLNADEVSKAAAEARKKSRILQPVVKHEPSFRQETGSSFGSSGRRMVPRPENNRRRSSKRGRLPADPHFGSATEGYSKPDPEESSRHPLITSTSTSLAPLQLEARSAFRTSLNMLGSGGIVSSSPESSFGSPDIEPFRLSSSGPEEPRHPTGMSAAGATVLSGIPLSRSTSDGYEASGGEDSDRVPTRLVQRSKNWSNILFGSHQELRGLKSKASSSSGQANDRKL